METKKIVEKCKTTLVAKVNFPGKPHNYLGWVEALNSFLKPYGATYEDFPIQQNEFTKGKYHFIENQDNILVYITEYVYELKDED